MAGTIDVEIIRRIIRAGGAVVLNGHAGYLPQRVAHCLVVILLDILACHHVDIGVGIEICLRQTIRRDNELVEIELF